MLKGEYAPLIKMLIALICGLFIIFGGVFLLYKNTQKLDVVKEEKSLGETENTEDLSCYSTPYTYIEKNEQGFYEAYIYSSVVQWWDGEEYKKIDNTLIESTKEEYIYENASNKIKTYLPGHLSVPFVLNSGLHQLEFYISDSESIGNMKKYVNIYGEEKEAVCYKVSDNLDIYVYPINSGLHMEYVYQEGARIEELPHLYYKTMDAMTENIVEDYVILTIPGELSLHVSAPMIYEEKEGKLNYWQSWENEVNSKSSTLWLANKESFSEGEVRIEYRIQFSEESIPDTTVYQNKERNTYLSDRAIIGNQHRFGSGIYYMRYRLNYFWEMDTRNILEAKYIVKQFESSSENNEIKLYPPTEQWSSTQMLWLGHVSHDAISQNKSMQYMDDNWLSFDITEFVKEAWDDYKFNMESWGSVMECTDGYKIIATSDHGEYIPYLKVIMKNLPISYKHRVTINDMEY